MSEGIKMSGRLLIFDKPSLNRILFPKEIELLEELRVEQSEVISNDATSRARKLQDHFK